MPIFRRTRTRTTTRTTGETVPERQAMRAILTSFGIKRALCLALLLALAIAPAIEVAHHGPGTLVAEADHHAHHAATGHHHPDTHHDSGDHDHVSVALLANHAAEVHADPAREVLSGSVVAAGSRPDGPRRPPRPMLI